MRTLKWQISSRKPSRRAPSGNLRVPSLMWTHSMRSSGMSSRTTRSGASPTGLPGVNHPPVEKVREMYTAKFVYKDSKGKRVGAGS